jgi:drug/metabolite transporter (DMT)-like permease
MLEVVGYIACGLIIGVAAVVSGRMRTQQAMVTVGVGLIGTLLLSITPYLGEPQDKVRAALGSQGFVTLGFFLALLAALCYGCLQILAPGAPDHLVGRLRRWENATIAFGALMLIVALAATRLTLAAVA